MKIVDPIFLANRRGALATVLADVLSPGDVVLFFAGDPISKPGGLDQTYPFLPHPEYLWLTGLRRPRGVVAFTPEEGWVEFVELPTDAERLWEGGDETISGTDISGFDAWFGLLRPLRVFVFGSQSSIEKFRDKGLNQDQELQSGVQEVINRVRRRKDSAEIALIERAASCAHAGYKLLREAIRPGVTEREVQIAFEAEVLRAGADKFPYETIVGSGTNAAVLHAIPTSKTIREDELVLVDAGADVFDYCADVTRVFSSSGKFSQQQQDLYDLVLSAEKHAIDLCKPGVEWRDVHRGAARVLASGLRDLDILRCDPDLALESEAISVFFPHGVGHMVGLRVRDVGGVAGKTVETCCGVRLRVDLVLEEDFVMTVEPGLYFVKPLLDKVEIRNRFRDEINWSEVERWRDIGGVRIEDNILLTRNGPRNLTAEIEK